MVIQESGYELIQKIVAREIRKIHLLEYGRVESVDLHETEDDGINYTCSVLLLERKTDDGKPIKLERVPIATPHTGSIAVPYVDDMVLVSFVDGNFEMPVIIGRLYCKEKKAPLYREGDNKLVFDPDKYRKSDVKPHVNKFLIRFSGSGKKGEPEDEFKIEFQDGPTVVYNPTEITLKGGKSKITLKHDGEIELVSEKDIKITTEAEALIECKNCKIKASGTIDLGEKGSGVITEASHKCYFTGAPLIGSKNVKAKM